MKHSGEDFFASSVSNRRCAQCWKPMVLRFIDGEWTVICPRGCQPGGHVSAGYVDHREHQDALDAERVAANYPELDEKKSTPEELEAKKKALWG